MKYLVVSLALLTASVSAVSAQTVPDLKGNWVGKGKAVVYGTNKHHPGSQKPTDPARVREIEATHVVEGQDGRVAWGRSSSRRRGRRAWSSSSRCRSTSASRGSAAC